MRERRVTGLRQMAQRVEAAPSTFSVCSICSRMHEAQNAWQQLGKPQGEDREVGTQVVSSGPKTCSWVPSQSTLKVPGGQVLWWPTHVVMVGSTTSQRQIGQDTPPLPSSMR